MPPIATLRNDVYQSGRFAVKMFQARGPRSSELDLLQFAMPIGLGIMGLVRHGEEDHGLRPKTHINLLTALSEGIVSSVLLARVRWAYLLIATGWTAYEVGGVATLSEKIKTLFKGAALFGSGVLGVRLGEDLRSYLRLRDAQETVKSIRQFEHYAHSAEFQTLPPTARDIYYYLKPEMSQLAEANAKLKRGDFNIFPSHTFTEANIKEMRRQQTSAMINEIESRFLNKTRTLSAEHLSDLKQNGQRALENVLKFVERSHSIGWFRRAQPMFGYLTALSFIGYPLASLLDHLVRTKKTGFYRHHQNHFIAPLYLGRTANAILKRRPDTEEVVVPMGDGPALLASSNEYASV